MTQDEVRDLKTVQVMTVEDRNNWKSNSERLEKNLEQARKILEKHKLVQKTFPHFFKELQEALK